MGKRKHSRLTESSTCENVILHIVFLLTMCLCLVPFVLLIMISLSSESSLVNHGYQLIPSEISLTAYRFLLGKSTSMLQAYWISIYTTAGGTAASVIITLMFAYPLSRKDYKYRTLFSFLIFFSMIFHGGMVAGYMVKVQILGLKNSPLVYMVGALMSSWNVMLMRTFLQTSIPEAMVEAAKVDGAGEFRAFTSIIVPLSLPGMATIALLTGVGIWNDWFSGALFITDSTKQNLQSLMYQTIQNAEYLKQHMNEVGGDTAAMLRNMPTESARMAMCVFAVGPIILVYPFLQKYFVKGMVIGAVKG
ncbi:MAG: carbohydrate ABC transporter permease [Candidatus Limiplasma sp.]|nr:carbohydrate ABC transporter permease [Candidatus Limiplasma sp.]MDY4063682.1 carbohydrate ABC transporter permease [Candidatus Limiplasma sp.]